MADRGLIQFVRNNKWIYKSFAKGGFHALHALKLFVRPDDHLILFNSFGGKKYDDSPRAIYEMMRKDARFKGYKLVWALNNPEQFPEIKRKVKSDSLQYFITALKARCWISNTSIQRGIDFKGKNTYSFNTWHGTPLKKMGAAKQDDYDNTIIKNNDTVLAQGRFEIDRLCEAWRVTDERFKLFGLPRNDVLANVTPGQKKKLRKKLGIPEDKTVIFYAPTYRDYNTDAMKSVQLNIPIDYDYWEKILGDKYIVLFRAHYEVAKYNKLPDTGLWRDVSDYEYLDDLMMVSDVLISDYSSLMFDYSIMEQPILGYTYDYQEYSEKRGMYFDIRKEITSFSDSKELVDYLISMDSQYETEKCKEFKNKYIDECGSATKKSVDWIYRVLSKEDS